VDVSVQEAAQHYAVAPATIRRWIKSGKLTARQHPLPQGFEWRVELPDHVQLADHDQLPNDVYVPDHSVAPHPIQADNAEMVDVQLPGHVQVTTNDQLTTDDQVPNDVAVVRALELVDRLQQQNMQLAGRIGWLEAQLQQANEQIRLLTDTQHASAQPTPEAEQTQPAEQPTERVPWWKWLFGA
jgi:hypothetical protein